MEPQMVRVFDMECNLPSTREGGGEPQQPLRLGSGSTFAGRERETAEGYGMANYSRIFTRRATGAGSRADMKMTIDEFADHLGKVGIEKGMVRAGTNDATVELQRAHPERFVGFAVISPYDGMRGVRELERLVREGGLKGLSMSPLTELIPVSDRRYYPAFSKAVELDIPVRVYSTMNYGTDRPYDLGHPRNLDQVCMDFPEMKLIAGLGGWPWVNEMVALCRRHPNLYMDTSSHRPRTFGIKDSGWGMLMQFGNTLIQDKVLTGISWGQAGLTHEELINEYLDLPLKDAVKEKWLYYNAARIFGLD
jgi:predicted TIM-barrel fold metal-dependent hydrolase